MNNSSIPSKLKLEEYLAYRYPITLCPEPDGGYTAIIPDLRGCMTQGDTLEEVLMNIDEARQAWIETAYEFDDEIPAPSSKNVWIA